MDDLDQWLNSLGGIRGVPARGFGFGCHSCGRRRGSSRKRHMVVHHRSRRDAVRGEGRPRDGTNPRTRRRSSSKTPWTCQSGPRERLSRYRVTSSEMAFVHDCFTAYEPVLNRGNGCAVMTRTRSGATARLGARRVRRAPRRTRPRSAGLRGCRRRPRRLLAGHGAKRRTPGRARRSVARRARASRRAVGPGYAIGALFSSRAPRTSTAPPAFLKRGDRSAPRGRARPRRRRRRRRRRRTRGSRRRVRQVEARAVAVAEAFGGDDAGEWTARCSRACLRRRARTRAPRPGR